MKHLLIPSFVLVLLLVVSVGCGPKAPYDLVRVEGVVTYAGKPLPKNFRLTFLSADGKRPSAATTQDDGKFIAYHTLQEDGVPKGKCQVTVVWGGDIGTTPPEEFAPMLEKYGFGTEGLTLEFTKHDKKYKLNFPE